MIRVELVRVGNFLIGKSQSDRWNLKTAGIGPLIWDRNQRWVKAARRKLAALGLTLAVVRNATVQLHATSDESDALGHQNVAKLNSIAA